jgi:hypothetical protein
MVKLRYSRVLVFKHSIFAEVSKIIWDSAYLQDNIQWLIQKEYLAFM